MRTKLFLAAIFLVFVFHLQAENVPVEKAIQVATQYYKRLDKVALRSMSTETMSLAYVSEPSVSLRSSAGTTVYFYVFNIGNDNGFIIISGDDRAYPVLGRSSEGSFDPEHLPPAFAQWLQMYREEIADVINRNLDIPTAPGWEDLYENLDINLRAVIEPLCKAKWNQGDPYNRSCPLTDKNERTITGCTATAMAIVMKYHQWPNQAQGSHSYDWSGRRLSVNFDNYDWKNMPNTYSEFGNDIQRAAVAKLMYHCGVSIESTYGTNGTSSSASYIPRALKTYFGYDMKVEYIYKSAYNDLEWKRILKNELDNNRPVVYRGAPPDNSSGHAFVCDGYNDNDEYHMNWGWGGFADGFWRLSTLEPPGYSFNTNQGMVVGIQPAQGNQAFSVLRIFNPGGVTGMTKNVTNVEKNQSFTVNSGAIINESYALFKGLIAVALMSTSGGIKEIVSPSVQQSLDPNYYFTRSFTCKATKDFSNTDILGMVSSTDGGNTWKRIYGGVNTVDFLPVASTVAVTGVSLNTNTQTLTAGGTFQLTPTITPANATNKSVTWTSTNQNVASVNSSGLVTTHNAGTATIIVATVDGNKQAICTVTVVAATIPVSGVSLDSLTKMMTVGGTFQLTATIAPSNATNKNVTWTSNNTNVASVNSSGLVTANSAGTATITVATVDGNKRATCTVTVVAATIPVTGVSLSSTAKTMTAGENFPLTATVTPSNATDKSVTWASNNTYVASVNSSGTVTANNAGTATITVTTVDGNRQATCTVTVVAATIPVSGVSLNSTARTMTTGGNFQLTATVTPSNATNKNVTWTSNNANVASVNSSGLVTANSAGTATITVATVDGNKQATCAVTVTSSMVSVTGITLDESSKTMAPGSNFQLTATVTPSNATNKNVTWVSGNPAVATVNSSGLVTANASGTVTIKATTVDGGHSASCQVTVSSACKSPIEGGYSGPITWILCANGTLTISGKGDIPGYIPNRLTHPWFKYRYYFSVVEIEATITGIGICAFYDCANLRTIVIPQNVTKIDYGAFWNCNALPAITIPKKVQYIGDEAFYNNANLRNVTVYWTTAGELPTLGNNVFKSLPADATLHVPVGTKGIYSSAPVWKNFNIVDDVVVLTSGDLGEFDSVFEIENITGIRNDNTDVPEARIFNQKLYVNSPVSETVAIYSINGTILFTAPKNTGQETYNVTNLPKGVYIVKGSSGWVKKVLKTE